MSPFALKRDAPSPGPDHAAILGALPLPVLLIGRDSRLLFVNDAAEQFLGFSAAQLLHMHLHDLVARDSPLFLLINEVRPGGRTVTGHDLTLSGPRLAKPGISVRASPMPDESASVLLALLDGSAAQAFDRQLASRGAARSLSGMAAVLAHEIKNPLSGIRGAAQLLEASVADADRELAALIREEADRIRGLLDHMEQFAGTPASLGALNIHRVLEHVKRLAESGFAKDVRLIEDYDPSLPPVLGDRAQLIQVVLNLVKNAAEAIASAGMTGGEITITTRFHRGMRVVPQGAGRPVHLPLMLSVRDNGPGIGADLRPHLFEPFVTTKRSGSGLGLALVAKIIGDHGGLIEVDSRPGSTEFRLHLPVLTEDPA